MDNLVLLRSFTYQHQLEIVQTCLESHGITVFVSEATAEPKYTGYSKDKTTVHLYVDKNDYEEALTLLNGMGVTPSEHLRTTGLLFQIINLSNRIPILKNVRPLYVLFSISLMFCGLLGYVLYTILTPNTLFSIAQEQLCAKRINFQGNTYIPNTLRTIKLQSLYICDEEMYLQDDESIRLPGFDSREVIGRWSFSNDSLHISNCDTFGFIYNGVYGVDIHHSTIVFSSATTQITCTVPKPIRLFQ